VNIFGIFNNLTVRRKSIFVLVCLFLISLCSGAEFYSSGSPDIDRMRAEVKESPTTADNVQKRALLLFVWLGSVQQQCADTHHAG